MRAFDWIGRTLLLILSGLATMALLTSIASVSDDAFDSAMAPPAAQSFDTTAAPGPAPGVPLRPGEGRLVPANGTDAPSAANPSDVIAERLDALTYAVLALAGFAAAILIVLLRMTAHLSRIADR